MDQRERRLGILRDVASAFDRHDIDGIMRHIADDAVFDAPRGDERWGTRFVGAEAVRQAFRDDKIVRKDSYWKIRTIPTA